MDLNIHELLAELDAAIMEAGRHSDDRKAYGMMLAKDMILKHGRIN